MNYKKIKEKNLNYFNRLLDESKDGHYVVAQSKISHLKRFGKLLELGDFRDKTLLDVGCGVGGFWEFLKDNGIPCDYNGIEINPRMIEMAQGKYPQLKDRFWVCDILETDLERKYDYVLSNGPLNLAFDDGFNVDVTLKLVRRMYDLAEIGAAITMTSALTRKPVIGTFYYNPLEILEGVLKFCTNVCFDHTYLPHDFAIFCYKRDLYDF